MHCSKVSIFHFMTFRRNIMGKYFLGWLLGVPTFVLVILYLLFN